MTKFVISGYIGFDNFGDELIASTLIKHLQEKRWSMGSKIYIILR